MKPLNRQRRSNHWTRWARPQVERLEDRLAPALFTVNTTADNLTSGDGDLTFREAMLAVNAQSLAGLPAGQIDLTDPLGTNDTIQFATELFAGGNSQTLAWAGLHIAVTRKVVVLGPGIGLLSIDAGLQSRFFDVASGGDLTVIGLRLSGGNANDGGAIANRGTLTLQDVVLENNRSVQDGGAILNHGTLAMTRTTLIGNSALNNNGGGLAHGSGTATIMNSTFRGNVANDDGGAIFSGAAITITGTTLSGNESLTNDGGGLAISSSGVTSILNSTLSGNSAYDNGGAVFNRGQLSITNCTITANRANTGGGIHSSSLYPLRNTIIAGNLGGRGTAPGDLSSAVDISTSINNLIGIGGDGGLTHGSNGNQVGIADPGLDILKDNGGPTETHALLAGGPALDLGSDAAATAAGLTTDQRGSGFTRFVGTVDIGALEAIPEPTTLVVDIATDESDGDYSTGDLSLREAIELANANPGTETIVFDTAGVFATAQTITLNGGFGALTIRSSLNIQGTGRNRLTINGNQAVKVFNITDFLDTHQTVVMRDLTIANGIGTHGGGIESREDLTLSNCNVTGNMASNLGGGIANLFGVLTVSYCTFSGNVGSGGGAIFNNGAVSIDHSILSGNIETDSPGIGASAIEHRGTMSLTNSTVSGNTGEGAAIQISPQSTVTITNSTVTNNRALVSFAGGIDIGIYLPTDSFEINNSIVAGNFHGIGATAGDMRGQFDISTSFNNLIGTGGSAGLFNGIRGNQVGVANPGLGPLQDNGGPTLTHALVPGSPAINAGSDEAAAGLTTDQRGPGFSRFLATVDIGAVEAPAAVALDDAWTTDEDEPLSGNVLANDLPPDILTATVVTGPTKGVLNLQANGDFTYTPFANANGTDSFIYEASGLNTDDTAIVTITITAQNDAPLAIDQSLEMVEDGSLAIALTGDDMDPEVVQNLTFAIAEGPSHGTLTGFDQHTGHVVYVPDPSYHGPDSFTFTITDDATAGAGPRTSAPGAVSITVHAAVYATPDRNKVKLRPDPRNLDQKALMIGGTNHKDVIAVSQSGSKFTVMVNGANKGTFKGVSGRIVVYGFEGNDRIVISPTVKRAVELRGGSGNDTLTGGIKDDLILGEGGNDVLTGRKGRDVLVGGAGADTVKGSAGEDLLIGGTTHFDASPIDLVRVLQEWSSVRTYAQRIANVQGTGSGPDFDDRLNRNVFLTTTGLPTVFTDSVKDRLVGGADLDWYFASLPDDDLPGVEAGEVITE